MWNVWGQMQSIILSSIQVVAIGVNYRRRIEFKTLTAHGDETAA
jgi:hypothetical protein